MVPAANGLKDSGCLHCYAKDRDDRHLQEPVSHWGKGAARRKSKSAVKDAFKYNRHPLVCDCGTVAIEAGDTRTSVCPKCQSGYHRRWIFSLSLGDWLDDEVPIEWLAEMLDTIRQCDQVTWILCTKRPENWHNRLLRVATQRSFMGATKFASDWLECERGSEYGIPPENIILLASVENQAMADLRIPQLLKIPAACRGLSLEPLLGPVNLDPHWLGAGGRSGRNYQQAQIDWLIIGSESGPHRRECKTEWVRSLVSQGKAAGVATFVKQLQDSEGMVCKDVAEFPSDLQIQEWPAGF